MVKEEEWYVINDLCHVIGELKVFRDDIMEERNPILLVHYAKSRKLLELC